MDGQQWACPAESPSYRGDRQSRRHEHNGNPGSGVSGQSELLRLRQPGYHLSSIYLRRARSDPPRPDSAWRGVHRWHVLLVLGYVFCAGGYRRELKCISLPRFCVYWLGHERSHAHILPDHRDDQLSVEYFTHFCDRRARVFLDVPARTQSAGGSYARADADCCGCAELS